MGYFKNLDIENQEQQRIAALDKLQAKFNLRTRRKILRKRARALADKLKRAENRYYNALYDAELHRQGKHQ